MARRTYEERHESFLKKWDRYPYRAMAPVGKPFSKEVRDDPTFGSAIYVPFDGDGETGWTAWFFESEALYGAFIRRFQYARPLKEPRLVTDRKPGSR